MSVRLLLACVAWMGSVTLLAESIWIEGESPTSQTMNRHPFWYDKVKKEGLSGRDFITNFNDDKQGEATYEFTSKKDGRSHLWIRANPTGTKLSLALNSSEWREVITGAKVSDKVNIAEDNAVDLRFLAWIDAGPVELKAGPNRMAIRMHSDRHNHGMVDAFLFTDEGIIPQGIAKPEALAESARKRMEAERDWIAFAPAGDAFANSAIDLRFLNERVAGENGIIGTLGDRFIHVGSGKPVRFWAVNGPPSDAKTPEELRRVARSLAKRGVNMVRVHTQMFDDAGNADPRKVQRAVAIVEAMKAEGIYTHFSIYFPLWLKPKPGTSWLQGYDGNKHPFAALFFNKDFQRQYQSWWRELLHAVVPSSGKHLAQEPAVAGLEILNEDSFFFWTFNENNVPDAQLRILETQFGKWLVDKHGSIEKAVEKWGNSKLKRDMPGEGRVGFRPLYNMFTDRTLRDQETAQFLFETQRAFYEGTYHFLRGLGFEGVITASNWSTASPEVFGPLEKWSYSVGDFIDRHGYFSTLAKGEFSEWSIRQNHTYVERSGLRFDAEQPGKPRMFVHPAMDPTYADKPSMISETTWNRPNRYRSEAPLYFAVYGALQGTDAIVHFALDGSNWSTKPNFWVQPWTLMSPAMMGQFPAAALLYRRGLVEEGAVVSDIKLSTADLLALRGTPLPQDAALDELRARDLPTGVELKSGQRIDPLVHYVGKTRVTFTNGPAGVVVDQALAERIDRDRKVVRSSHDQLALNYDTGLLTINAPAAQGVSGHLSRTPETRLKDMTIHSEMELGHIVVVSLDEQPISQAKRLLVQAMSEEKPTGFVAEEEQNGVKRIKNLGTDPWMIRKLSGSVVFHREDAGHLQIQPLDANGYPVGKVSVGNRLELEPGTIYYLVTSN